MFSQQLNEALTVIPWDIEPVEESGGMKIVKGYLDMGGVDPDMVASYGHAPKQGLIDRLEKLLWDKGVAFIRDPDDIISKIPGLPKGLPDLVREAAYRRANEEAGLANERDEFDVEDAWRAVSEKIRKSKVTVTRVQGKTAKGWKIQMGVSPKALEKQVERQAKKAGGRAWG